MRVTWDVFCRVIDNFGDIGVTWRLAQQLNQEHGFAVRLWVDDLSAFHAICPAVSTTTHQQTIAGVEICWWTANSTAVSQQHCAQVVIEAFACQLPAAYINLMRAQNNVLWLNLEYLTAEPWAAECHALPSMQGTGLQKYFFFPGFTEQTGGLLREASLLSQRDAFLTSEVQQAEFLASLGVQTEPNERLISLFAYANPALPSWLDALSSDICINHILLLQGPLIPILAEYFALPELQQGRIYQRGSLKVQVLPYIQQENFDRLLWSCDFNCVRGEDSFVRAQWAAKPFLWHIYPQQDDAHLDKLQAFLSIYNKELDEESKVALESLCRAWNTAGDMQQAWQHCIKYEKELHKHAIGWCEQQRKLPDLATKLACFYQDWL